MILRIQSIIPQMLACGEREKNNNSNTNNVQAHMVFQHLLHETEEGNRRRVRGRKKAKKKINDAYMRKERKRERERDK